MNTWLNDINKWFNNIYKNMNKLSPKNIIYGLQILLSIIIIFLITRLYNRKEHLVNWYRPFYNKDIIQNPLINTKDVYARNTLNNKYNFDELTFGSYYEDSKNKHLLMDFLEYIVKIILQNSNILNISIKTTKYCYELLNKINNNSINIGLVSAPVLYDGLIGEKFFKKRLSNIRFIGNINNISIFFFISKTGSIKSLYDLQGAKIGVIHNHSTSKKCADNILNGIDFIEGTDYKYSYHTLKDGLKLLGENKLDCFIYDSVFPSNDLTNIFENDIIGEIQILPLDEIKEDIFTSRYIYYQPIYIDLNKLSKNYLPCVFGKYHFSKFKPMLKTYSFHNYLCCNKNVSNNTTYNLIKSIYDNIPIINQLEMFKNHQLQYNSVAWTSLPISIHNGVKQFFYEKGYISYGTVEKDGMVKEDPNCIFLIGKKECNKKNLKRLNVPPVDYTFL